MLKLDPKNPTLLAQKQKVLNEELTTSQEKLKQLKEIQQQYIDNGGDLNTENYRALEREIEKVTKQVKTLTLETNKFYQAGQKLTEVGGKIQNVGKRISNLGDKLTKIGTTAGIAIGGIAVKSAIDFESAFTGVKKTVDGTPEQLEKIKQGIKEVAKVVPSTTEEIASVAETAGQLGIETDNIIDFTKAMIDLTNSTNLSIDEGASQLAKFENIMGTAQDKTENLGSAIVDLGNNYATTEKDIVNMAMRLAGAGKQVGLSEGDVLGLATALSSVGVEAEMGGSAFSKAMVKMQSAVEVGGSELEKVLKVTNMSLRDLQLMSDNDTKSFKELASELGLTKTELKNMVTAGAQLQDFAKISGMTTEQFKKQWKEDATGAITAFIKGLGDTRKQGKSAIALLQDMGLSEVRLRDSLLRAANSGDLFSKAIKTGNNAFKENTALSKEANQRYKTLESRLKTTKNNAINMAISLGDKLTPAINRMLDKVNSFIDKMSNLSEEEAENVLKMGLIVVAAGPVIKIFGKLTSGVGTAIKGIGTFSKAISVMQTGVETGETSIDGLAKVLTGLTSPAGLVTLAIAGITTGLIAMTAKEREMVKQTKESFKTMGTAASDYIAGIDTAKSHLDEFNRTLFVSSEEQRKLEEEMDEVQQGITKICQTASKERRDYTQKEIKQLDEYFERLRTLNQRELEIEQSIAKAISQQAVTNAETFKGSLEEYKTQSQEWIKTAEDQKAKEVELINTQTTEEIALLNQRFGNKADMANEAYKKEYEKIINQKEKNIEQVEQEISTVTQKYAEGYLERAKQEDGFYTKIEEVHKKQQEEMQSYNNKILQIEKMTWLDEDTLRQKKEQEEKWHNLRMNNLWKEAYTNMSKSQKEQLGSWVAMVSDAEVQGGKLDEETKKVVDEILNSFDNMPEDSKRIMGETMQGMMNGMKEKEPSLFQKATGIADGILSRLRKTFDINSPSKETRDIFRYVMKGAELGLEDERKNLMTEADKVAKETLQHFNIADTMFNNGLKNNIIDSTKTVFTTPQIVFNVQELDEAKLQQCFNYINRKFGSAY